MVRQSPAGGVDIAVRVIPNAGKSALAGQRAGRLLVRIAAPPLDGRANDALEGFLAGVLDVPKRAVSVVHGDTIRNKRVLVEGLTLDVVRARLQVP